MVVCSVPKTRCPVSAVSIAIAMVSRSRSSPTSTMSGSSRSAARRARLNDSVWWYDLALVHEAPLVVVHELDRVLDRDDVVGAVLVDVVDHRGQRRGLSRAGRPGDQHEALVQHAQVLRALGQAKVVEGQDLVGDLPEHRAYSAAVPEQVDAEPRDPGDLVGEVGVVVLAELVSVGARRDLVAHEEDVLRGQCRVEVLQGSYVAVEPDHRGEGCAEVQVAAAQLHQPAQHAVQRAVQAHLLGGPGMRLRRGRRLRRGLARLWHGLDQPQVERHLQEPVAAACAHGVVPTPKLGHRRDLLAELKRDPALRAEHALEPLRQALCVDHGVAGLQVCAAADEHGRPPAAQLQPVAPLLAGRLDKTLDYARVSHLSMVTSLSAANGLLRTGLRFHVGRIP